MFEKSSHSLHQWAIESLGNWILFQCIWSQWHRLNPLVSHESFHIIWLVLPSLIALKDFDGLIPKPCFVGLEFLIYLIFPLQEVDGGKLRVIVKEGYVVSISITGRLDRSTHIRVNQVSNHDGWRDSSLTNLLSGSFWLHAGRAVLNIVSGDLDIHPLGLCDWGQKVCMKMPESLMKKVRGELMCGSCCSLHGWCRRSRLLDRTWSPSLLWGSLWSTGRNWHRIGEMHSSFISLWLNLTIQHYQPCFWSSFKEDGVVHQISKGVGSAIMVPDVAFLD